jgi:uncharacterized protein YqfA (UPF0365 family)
MEAVFGVAAVVALAFFVFLLLFLSVVRVWLQGMLSGVPVGIADVIGMRLRRSPPDLIVRAAIVLKTRGVAVPLGEVETTYLAHGEGLTSPTELAELVLERRAKSTA